jgi:hypothetical protein
MASAEARAKQRMVGDIGQLRAPDGRAAGEFGGVGEKPVERIGIEQCRQSQREQHQHRHQGEDGARQSVLPGEAIGHTRCRREGQEAQRRFGMGHQQEAGGGGRGKNPEPVALAVSGEEEHQRRDDADRAGDVLVAIEPAPVADQRRVQLGGEMPGGGNDRDRQPVHHQDGQQHPFPDGEGALSAQRPDPQKHRQHDDDFQPGAADHDAGIIRPQRRCQAPAQQQGDTHRHRAHHRQPILLGAGDDDHAEGENVGDLA